MDKITELYMIISKKSNCLLTDKIPEKIKSIIKGVATSKTNTSLSR